MNCPYCNNKNFYTLNTGQYKCTKCKKKYSPKKIQQEINIISCFCENLTINQCMGKLNLNYLTIKKQYETFRFLVSKYLEEVYSKSDFTEYDEYVYLPKSKKKIKENIFDAQNFLTFSYAKNKVYNLPMPNLNKYKNQLLDDKLEDIYFKEFSKFMMLNKIAKTQKRENIISRFWIYLEEEILKYKGINAENFFYYLKEIEFKFNYSKDEAKKILYLLYSKYKYL